MQETDQAYYARRAREERQKSENAADPATYRTHLEFARHYERRAALTGLRLVED